VKLRELPGALDRAQHGRVFKITASVIMAVLAIGIFAANFVAVTSGSVDAEVALAERIGVDPSVVAENSSLQLLAGIASSSGDVTAVGVWCAVGLLVALVVIWLGLGLTYLALLGGAAAVAVPLSLYGPTEVYARLIVGLVALTASFTALMQGLRVVFGGPGRVSAVARNVLNEAVRMKISLVFIVLLIVGLAALPGLLDDEQPLRYRVQSFLQWGTGFSFWVLGILVVLFGAATVAFEQRDKIIWQTMTKPVAAWEYILGKWLGVVGLAAVLLFVCASGIFLFTDYLRGQPAVGEREAYVARDGDISEDRLILETQILTARSGAPLYLPPQLSADSPQLQEAVTQRIERERIADPNFARTPAEANKVMGEMVEQLQTAYRSIEPGQARRYQFRGLGIAKERNSPLTFRYRIDAEGNRPDRIYTMTFVLPDGGAIVRDSGLGFLHNVSISPEYIADDGTLTIEVINGRLVNMRGGAGLGIEPNAATVTFPATGLDVTYSVGSYQMNYLRAMIVLWVKLAFVAMVAVWASTFLSFPVACLVAGGIFIMAEGAGWLGDAADIYGTTDVRGELMIHRFITTNVTVAISNLFSVYTDLKPIGRIVDGVRLPLSQMGAGIGVLTIITGAFYGLAVAIFRRRELATYSGQ
jgi:ABC-type transport system involved in multi-copper enzyme maturation permease subunit